MTFNRADEASLAETPAVIAAGMPSFKIYMAYVCIQHLLLTDALYDQPGIEPAKFHFGVNQGKLSLNQFVSVTSTAAAKLYGLYPRKGTLAPGADADIVLFDPTHEITISAQVNDDEWTQSTLLDRRM